MDSLLRGLSVASQHPLAASLAPAIIMSCSEVLSLERRALAEMTGDVGVTFSGGLCWKSLSSVMWLNGMGAHQRISQVQIKENTNTLNFWYSFAYICGHYTLSLRLIKLLNFKFNLLQHWTTGRYPGISLMEGVKSERHFVRDKTFPDFSFWSGSTLLTGQFVGCWVLFSGH